MMPMPIRRGCGDSRTPGDIYGVTEFSSHGIPLRLFLYDPPWIPRDKEGEIWYPGAQGVAVALRPGSDATYDVWDWIGAGIPGYPFFPDFWEEGRRFEFSRKMPQSTPFGFLEAGISQMIGIHPKGLWIAEQDVLEQLYDSRLPGLFGCPFEFSSHMDGKSEEFCISLLWQMVDDAKEEGRVITLRDMPRGLKEGERPSFTYACAPKPSHLKGEWVPAAVYHLPIHKLEVINDPLESTHEVALEKLYASGTNIHIDVVDE